MSPGSGRKLQSIQYLRGVAALGVVLTHASTSLFNGDRALIPFPIGGMGVDLFFVISGFIMFYTTRRGQMTPVEFYTRRCIRIVPLYFILTTAAFALAVAVPGALRTVSTNPHDYLRSILFIPFRNAQINAIEPVLPQGWTLNYEMFFYLVFGVCLLLSRGTRVIICVSVFAALSLVGTLLAPEDAIIRTYTDRLTMEFVFGMVLGYLQAVRPGYLSWVAVVAWLTSAALGALYMLQVNLAPLRFLAFGIPAVAMVATGLWLDGAGRIRHLALLMLLGDASYSIYLSHAFVLGALRRAWPLFFDSNLVAANAAFMGAALVATAGVGVVIYRLLESRLTAFLNGRLVRLARAVH